MKPSQVRPVRMLRIGALASASGVTVRTLHYYEDIGLLKSSGRTEGGHRVFSADSVERLYQIRTMRELGLTLTEIVEVLKEGGSTENLLANHLVVVEREIERLHLLRDRLQSLTSRPRTPLVVAELIANLDLMSQVERHGRKQKGKTTVALRVRTGEAWEQLGVELRACMDAGYGHQDGRACQLAGEAQSLIDQFADGDAQIIGVLKQLRRKSPPRDLIGWDPKLMAYLDAALSEMNDMAGQRPGRSSARAR